MLTDEQIFDILDGHANAELLNKHTHLLTSSLDYKKYFKELEAIHFDLAELPLEYTSVDFAEKILSRIPEEKPVFVFIKRKTRTTKLTYGFIGAVLIMILITIGFAIGYQASSATPINQPQVFTRYLNDFRTDSFVKITVLLNLIIILAVFDKKILRPYFNHRKITLG